MSKHYPQPTIIGSGLTGLLISLALSKAQISHRVIGGPPPTGSPRLGESLNLEATIFFLKEFPELAEYYYEKAFASVYIGDYIGKFHFSFISEPRNKAAMRLWGKEAPDALIHFDRVRLDAALYERAVNSPYCTQMDGRVAQVVCAPGSDRIEQLILQDGTTLPVSHVFDATGYIRLLARQLQIPRRMLGVKQHVVYTHYFRDAQTMHTLPDAPWHHGTNIIRLYRERHGLDLMAWCIPLGSTISVGMTTPENAPRPSDEELAQRVAEAFAEYGVTFMDECVDRSRLATAKMEFYTHARGYGSNWLLAGAAHTQVWWPTSGGVDTSVAAANMAVPFLTQPQEMGASYDEYMQSLVRAQTLWNWGAGHPPVELTRQRMDYFVDRLIWSISYRFLLSLKLERADRLARLPVSLSAQIWGNEIWSRLPAPAQIETVARA